MVALWNRADHYIFMLLLQSPTVATAIAGDCYILVVLFIFLPAALRVGLKKLTFLLRFDQNVEYKII